jgi:hypothetical protein
MSVVRATTTVVRTTTTAASTATAETQSMREMTQSRRMSLTRPANPVHAASMQNVARLQSQPSHTFMNVKDLSYVKDPSTDAATDQCHHKA